MIEVLEALNVVETFLLFSFLKFNFTNEWGRGGGGQKAGLILKSTVTMLYLLQKRSVVVRYVKCCPDIRVEPLSVLDNISYVFI